MTLLPLLCCLLMLSPIQSLNIGMNLPSNNYYNNFPEYADVFHQTSGNNGRWDVADNGVPDQVSLVDSTGAPIPTPIGGGRNSTRAWTGFTRYFPAGSYSLSYDGTGSISFSHFNGIWTSDWNSKLEENAANPLVIVRNFRRMTLADGTVRNLATVQLPGPDPNAGPSDNAWIQIIATFPVTNLKLLSPSNFQIPNSVFRSDFISTVGPFSTLRFMDSFYTNGNKIQDWSERTLPTQGSRGGTKQGMAYEDVVDLITLTKKNAWINVPVRASDDYVCRMARFFILGEPGPTSDSRIPVGKYGISADPPCSPTAPPTPPFSKHFNSSHTIYLEYSNEVWNYGFQQAQDFLCMANNGQYGYGCSELTQPTSKIATTALNNNSLGWISSQENRWGRASQLMFVMAKRVVDIFRTVLSLSPSPPKLETLMNVQFVYPNCYYYAYPFFSKNFGNFGDTFMNFAVAPYFNIDNDTYSGSVNAIFDNIENDILNSGSNNPINIPYGLSKVVPFAKNLNSKLIAYEGGQALNGETNVQNKINAQSDPRMYTCTRQYLQIWQSIVGNDNLFNYFSLAGAYSKYGCWGALSSMAEHGSQKYDSLMSLVAVPGDANLDGVVNALDCNILKINYHSADNNTTATQLWWRDADFNHDGVVNSLDLQIMNARAQPKCQP